MVSTAVLLVILPELAVIFVVPVATAVARPLLLIVATPVLDEPHVTSSVMLVVVPSFNVPMALNCWVPSERIDALFGVTAIDARFAIVIVTLVAPLMAPDVAVTLTVPGSAPVTSPLSEIVASLTSEEDQLTEVVIVFVLPSL